jgi:hypothetical protein
MGRFFEEFNEKSIKQRQSLQARTNATTSNPSAASDDIAKNSAAAAKAARQLAARQLAARLQVQEKQRFESNFSGWYKAPSGCDNWRSDAHMVDCVNHRMQAKVQYQNVYSASLRAGDGVK